MFRRLCFRAFLTIINLIFPPLAVMILTGPETDTLMNSVLFLCGVLPSHVHGFYISCVYFHRRAKAKKGQYPGDPKPFIYSSRVINGGISNAEVDEILRRERGLEKRKSSRRSRGSHHQTQMQQTSSNDAGISRMSSRATGQVQSMSRTNTQASRGVDGVSRVGSRTGVPDLPSRVNSRRQAGYDSVGSSPASPQSPQKYW